MNLLKGSLLAVLGISVFTGLGCGQGSSNTGDGSQNILKTDLLGDFSAIAYHRLIDGVHLEIDLATGVAKVGVEPNETNCTPSQALSDLLASAKLEIQILERAPSPLPRVCPMIAAVDYDTVTDATDLTSVLGDSCGSNRDYKDSSSRDRSHELFQAYRAHCVPLAPGGGAI